ncbi:MAG: alpha-glucosidase [Bifidobacterium psychraerophilum]|uniref:glycoside hydrolase family 13 protein n=1 Tax=Bifidobacterium psychraerophilum TaxID=218140 RepID=UPI0039E972A8
MTVQQRELLPDSIRTNGATVNPWWANAVVYQIYPRSFQDSNNDGIGDLQGIISRLDYLANLGVDVIWLSPVYKSPQDDNGYDISDYQDIDPMFGTLYDMDDLIAAVHERGMRIIIDLVVNHTSDEHAWFEASREGSAQYADWYWWRPTKEGHTPGAPGSEPNNWGSDFGGSAWEYSPDRGEYYLHSFSPKQPDLNWENPAVRQAVYDMMNWWMDRGIDGFRMDVITLISKPLTADGDLPDGVPGEDGYANAQIVMADGPRLDEFLSEMRHAVFEGREGFLTVGEAPGITPDRNREITDPSNHELDMLFLFHHVEFDARGSKWNPLPLDIVPLKRIMASEQEAVEDSGWASLFFNNHDQPRVVSRWGDTTSEESRTLSAKALGLVLHMHRGTPYIYQGEELGMTNAGFTALDQYRDIESLDLYRLRVLAMKLSTHDQMLEALGRRSRDNARTPMQWDSSAFAGFTDADSPTEPWLPVNPNKEMINASDEEHDPNSVLAFYRELIHLRHSNPVIAAGRWSLLDGEDKRVYAFVRSLEGFDLSDTIEHQQVVVVANLTGRSAQIPPEAAAALGLDPVAFPVDSGMTIDEDNVLISNYPRSQTLSALFTGRLSPWEAFVYQP